MPRHVQVGVNDFESVAAPGTLGTDSLVTCTGVALVHERRAFILHASGVAMDPKSVIVPFFQLLAKRIPAEARGQVVPVVTGAGVGGPSRGAGGERERADARADQMEILRRLGEAGFATAEERWAGPCQEQSLFVNPGRRFIRLETKDTLDEDLDPEVETFPV